MEQALWFKREGDSFAFKSGDSEWQEFDCLEDMLDAISEEVEDVLATVDNDERSDGPHQSRFGR